jgi:hypothetical protein
MVRKNRRRSGSIHMTVEERPQRHGEHLGLDPGGVHRVDPDVAFWTFFG